MREAARLRTARTQLARGSSGEDVGEALQSQVVQQLRARRAEGGVSTMTWISLIGIALGVMALIATLAIFLPSMLLLIAVMPVWAKQAANPKARGAVAAIAADTDTTATAVSAAATQPITEKG